MNRRTPTTTIVPTISTSTREPPIQVARNVHRSISERERMVRVLESTNNDVPISILTSNVPVSTSNDVPIPTTTRNEHRPMVARERIVRVLTSTMSVPTTSRNVPTHVPHRSVYSIIGRPPASRIAVEMMPCVTIEEKETCVICLEEWWKSDVVTELPCKHKYHFECVKKWLGIHATCPQCRYEMPLECEEDVMKMVEVDDDNDDDSDSSDSDE